MFLHRNFNLQNILNIAFERCEISSFQSGSTQQKISLQDLKLKGDLDMKKLYFERGKNFFFSSKIK